MAGFDRLFQAGRVSHGRVDENTLWPFGSWKGCPLFLMSSEYIAWCYRECDWFQKLYPALYKYIDERFDDTFDAEYQCELDFNFGW